MKHMRTPQETYKDLLKIEYELEEIEEQLAKKHTNLDKEQIKKIRETLSWIQHYIEKLDDLMLEYREKVVV